MSFINSYQLSYLFFKDRYSNFVSNFLIKNCQLLWLQLFSLIDHKKGQICGDTI